jgi:hypothetical protein
LVKKFSDLCELRASAVNSSSQKTRNNRFEKHIIKEVHMRFGVVFPQTEIGADTMAIRDFAQAAEELGYQHILAYDHVIGANPAGRPGWRPPYTHRDAFHEPFVLFSYLAGLTRKIELVTGVIILPQRQTVLVPNRPRHWMY